MGNLGGIVRRAERGVDAVGVAGAALGGRGGGRLGGARLAGRTARSWQSPAWLAGAAGGRGGGVRLAGLLARGWGGGGGGARRGGGRRARGGGGGGGGAWPALFRLPGAGAAAAAYVDDGTNHLYVNYPATRESVLVYGLLLYGLALGWFWVARWGGSSGSSWGASGRHGEEEALEEASAQTVHEGRRPGVDASILLVGLGLAAYLNASVFLP